MTKTQALSIIALFWLLSIICGGVCGFLLYPKIYPCNQSVGTVKIEYIDSTAPNKDTAQKISFKPEKVGVKKYNGGGSQTWSKAHKKDILNSGPINEINGPSCGPTWSEKDTDSNESSCLDTNLYKFDTISVDNFRATATATVANNEILNMSVEWRNLKPELWKIKRETITVEKKQALVKVFPELYARATFNAVTATGGGAGGGASFVVKDKHMLGVNAGANFGIGQPVSGEVLLRYGVKLQLKK